MKIMDITEGYGRDVVEAIPKSTMYGLVIDGKYVAKGSKADMMKMKKEKGGTVYNAPGKKVGDSAGTVKERYGVRDEPNPGTSKAMQRQVNAINTNVTKRTNNKNADTNRELNIANKSLQRRANRLQKQKLTGIPNRILNPQPQPTPQQGQS